MKLINIATTLFSLCILCACQPHPSASAIKPHTISADKCKQYSFLQPYGCSILTLEQNAENGDINAAYILGYVYYYGLGTPTDSASGKLWIEKAANEGQPQAVKAMALIQRTQDKPSPAVEHTLPKHQNTQPILSKSIEKRSYPSSSTVRHPAPIKKHAFYTIQIMSTKADFSLEPLKRTYPDHHLNKLVHQDNQGIIWYTLISGHYINKKTALNGITSLPKALLKQKPWVRRIGE